MLLLELFLSRLLERLLSRSLPAPSSTGVYPTNGVSMEGAG